MKTIYLIIAGVFIISLQAFCQTNVVLFTNIVATEEQAIQLTWTSTSNESYQIQYANGLATNPDGSTAWRTLYDDYPSQGLSTFWLDTGNFTTVPNTPHPKHSPMRFYRVLDEGIDGLTNDEPAISITVPSSGMVATGELQIALACFSDQPLVISKLYVDGQEMNPSYDGTNYFINTCEWYNGEHTLFATATAYSTSGAIFGSTAPLIGHAVSAFVPVYFSNLVTHISFSEPFFEPSLGQTQEVTAYLTANSDWTLTIRDNSSNAVRTVTGGGNNLLFDWDGTSDGGTNVPAGVYYYYISAITNGLVDDVDTVGGIGSGMSGPLSPDDGSIYAWAVDTNGPGGIFPLAILPPGADTNGYVVFDATRSEIRLLRSPSSHDRVSSVVRSGFSPDLSGSAPASQTAPAAPDRPGSDPVANKSGTFGVGCDTYTGNPTVGYYQPEVPISGALGPIISYVTIEGHGTADPPKWYPIRLAINVVNNFAEALSQGGWELNLADVNDDLKLSDLKAHGDSNPFNTNDFAILATHGCYGTTSDMSTGQSFKGIYFPITAGTGASYLRMSDLNLGGSSTNSGLKWLCLDSCNSLYPANWNSMASQNVFPYNGNMHMILGGATELVTAPSIGTFFAQDMLGNPKEPSSVPPMTIRAAWYDASARGMVADLQRISAGDYPIPTQCTVAADPNCLDDYLQTKTNTVLAGGKWSLDPAHTVYPP